VAGSFSALPAASIDPTQALAGHAAELSRDPRIGSREREDHH